MSQIQRKTENKKTHLLNGKELSVLTKQCDWDHGKTVAVRLVPVRTQRVRQPLTEPHLCPHRPTLLNSKLVITTIAPSSCVSLGACRSVQLAVTKPFRICVRAGRMCTCWEMERGGEKRRWGERRGRVGWVVEGAAVVGTVKEQGEMGVFSPRKQAVRNGWLHQARAVQERDEAQPWPIAPKHWAEECF